MSIFKKALKSVTSIAKGGLPGATVGFLTGGLPGAAIGAGIGGYMSYQTDAQNKANQKAIDKANAYDLYTWDLANQYNNPISQMQRLKAAGLNPNLVYGSGNVTGNTTGQAGSNGVASQEVYNGISKGIQTAQAAANLQNTIANNKLLQFQQEKTDADRLYTEAQTTNLQNYLTGKGRSTYDTLYARPYEYVTGALRNVSDPVLDFIGARASRNVAQPIDPRYPAIGRNRKPGTGTEIDWYPMIRKKR